MTVVVCDGVTVAVDSGGSNKDIVHRVKKWELLKGDTELVVRVGNSMVSGAMLEWYKGEADFPSAAKLADGLAELIVFKRDTSTITVTERYSTSKVPDVMLGSCAFGSGRDFAYGAIFAGAKAHKAAAAACHYSPHCAAPLDLFILKGGVFVHEHHDYVLTNT